MTMTQPPGATVPIPYPPRRLLLGNLPDVANDKPVQSEMDLARRYGPIFELEILNRHMVILSSQALVNEVCDETRFDKQVWSPLQRVRALPPGLRSRTGTRRTTSCCPTSAPAPCRATCRR